MLYARVDLCERGTACVALRATAVDATEHPRSLHRRGILLPREHDTIRRAYLANRKLPQTLLKCCEYLVHEANLERVDEKNTYRHTAPAFPLLSVSYYITGVSQIKKAC